MHCVGCLQKALEANACFPRASLHESLYAQIFIVYLACAMWCTQTD